MIIRLTLVITLLVFSGFSLAKTSQQIEKLTIEDFVAYPDVFDAEFSPDGRYLAVIVKSKEGRMLVIRDFSKEGLPATGVVNDKFYRASSLSWANNDRLIVNFLVPYERLSKLRRKAESDPDFDIDDYAVHLRSVSMSVEAKDHVILLNHRRYAKNNTNLSKISNYLPQDNNHILMRAFGNRGLELIKVNVYTGKVIPWVKGGWRTYKYLTDNEGSPTYRLDYYYYSKSIRVFEYTEDEDWEEIDRINLNQEDNESINNEGLLRFGFGDNDSLIYRERNEQTGFYEIVKRARNSDKREVIASLPDKDIFEPIFGRNTGRYLGYRVLDDLLRDYYVDESTQAHYDIVAKEVGHSNFSIWASRKPGERTIINTQSLDNPGTFYIYNYKDKKVSFLGDKYKKLKPENLSLPGKIFYKTRDGVNIRMYILFPPGYQPGTRAPMVVLPHGGPHVRDSATYDGFAQFISTRGYIVIQPNFRGSSGYGREFEEAGYKQWGGVMQDDLTDAVKFMIKKGYADADRVCIVGGSYGGYAALMGAIKTPDLYQCSVSLNGVTHLKEQIEFDIDTAKSNEERGEEYVHKTIGHPEKDSAILDKNSPALRAKEINIPVLVIAGEKDKIVPVEQSEMMVEALEDFDKTHKYIELERTGHDVFYYTEDVKKIFAEVEAFLGEHIGEPISESKKEKK